MFLNIFHSDKNRSSRVAVVLYYLMCYVAVEEGSDFVFCGLKLNSIII